MTKQKTKIIIKAGRRHVQGLDVVQPWDKRGKPNRLFVRIYGPTALLTKPYWQTGEANTTHLQEMQDRGSFVRKIF